MKNLFKRTLLLALAAIMVISCAGCNKKVESNANFEVDLNSDVLITKEPVELSYFFRASKDDDGQYGIYKEAAYMTGVMAKTTVSKSNSDLTQAFNLMLASGEIPDLVFTQDELQFMKYGMDGAFVPLNKHFDKMPNFKKFLEENPTVKKNLTAVDGNIYYLPFCPGGKTAQGWFVREDWMEKLGLKNPTNAEELYDVLTAFKTQDPNGNGKADEIPFFGATTTIADFFPLWDARQSWYLKDGSIGFGPLDPEYKTALQNIIKWYNEGLLDKEIVTSKSSPRDRVLTENIGGMTCDWFASTSRVNDTIKDIPGFKFTPFAPPKDIILGQRAANSNYGWGIYSGTKYLDIAVKYLDFWFSEKGSNLINFGKEGVHWNMVDGKPQFTAELLAKDDPVTEIRNFGCQQGIGYKQNFDYEKQWMNQIAVDGMTMYEEGNWFAELVPPVYMQMSAAEREEYTTLKTNIETYYDECFQKWILGSLDFEKTYDKFVKEIKTLGVDRLLELQNEAYDRYLSIE